MSRTTILIDEQRSGSKYIVCEDNKGRFTILEKGMISGTVELRSMQLRYNARVEIDCAFMGSELESAAHHYSWKLLRVKQGAFPYTEALVQLAG